MTQNIAVLALDAGDYRLLNEWGCDNILLNNHTNIETFAHSYDLPYTPEVWATVATGKMPHKHGVEGRKAGWNNPILDSASGLYNYLPTKFRAKTGLVLEKVGFQTQQTNNEMDTIFKDGMVTQWPGITEATHFKRAQELMSLTSENKVSEEELWNELITKAGMEVGWLSATARTESPISGIHSHILDTAGHVYSSRSKKLEEYYTTVDDMVGHLIDDCDDLVIVSDHGMEVSHLGDPNPGKHSWHSFISTTLDSNLPERVQDIHGWLSEHISTERSTSDSESLDAPEEHLRDLGYF